MRHPEILHLKPLPIEGPLSMIIYCYCPAGVASLSGEKGAGSLGKTCSVTLKPG